MWLSGNKTFNKTYPQSVCVFTNILDLGLIYIYWDLKFGFNSPSALHYCMSEYCILWYRVSIFWQMLASSLILVDANID